MGKTPKWKLLQGWIRSSWHNRNDTNMSAFSTPVVAATTVVRKQHRHGCLTQRRAKFTSGPERVNSNYVAAKKPRAVMHGARYELLFQPSYWLTMENPAMWSLVSASSVSFASMSTSPGTKAKSQVLVFVSVWMFDTPGTFFKSFRTETAQPPQVMPGRLNEIILAPAGVAEGELFSATWPQPTANNSKPSNSAAFFIFDSPSMTHKINNRQRTSLTASHSLGGRPPDGESNTAAYPYRGILRPNLVISRSKRLSHRRRDQFWQRTSGRTTYPISLLTFLDLLVYSSAGAIIPDSFMTYRQLIGRI